MERGGGYSRPGCIWGVFGLERQQGKIAVGNRGSCADRCVCARSRVCVVSSLDDIRGSVHTVNVCVAPSYVREGGGGRWAVFEEMIGEWTLVTPLVSISRPSLLVSSFLIVSRLLMSLAY